jgi:hypothetical protein
MKRDINRQFRHLWRGQPVRAAFFIGSAAIVALAVSYIAAAAGF